MTEEDAEDIWDATLDTTRFGKINVRMGSILNFWLTQRAGTDITDVDVLPILEQISEEAMFELHAAAKLEAVDNPWDFVASKVTNVMSRKIRENKEILQMVSDKLNGRLEVSECNLASYSNKTYGESNNLYNL